MYPQQPQGAPAQAPHPAAPPAPRGRTTAVVVALLAGLVLGGGGVAAAWALTGDSGTTAEGTAPADDARAACRALDGFDEKKYGTKGAQGDIALNRYSAAGTLSAAAAAGDAEYRPLAEAMRRAQNRQARVFEFDATVEKDLEKARGICADL
ncbi:hypothetical protein [Streptomyces xanthii]|uniref:hypothetical protein n=1 Tax=Streptomyces xanthii TaxID=2768069 RepID=UPI001CB783FF|nr:hypothetical protein [Streptomyces xanthii]